MKPASTFPAALLAGLALSACVSAPPLDTPAERQAAEPRTSPAHASTGPGATQYAEPVLYARDGTPVAGGGAEVAQEAPGPLAGRDLAGSQGGRMYILELYQNVIEERDRLSLEVSALNGELDNLRQALAQAGGRIDELEAAGAAAEEENRRLRAENVDLAGRLTTAQVRRLQAEKILLELRLAELEEPARPNEEAAGPRTP